jgi:hypothetical protein
MKDFDDIKMHGTVIKQKWQAVVDTVVDIEIS